MFESCYGYQPCTVGVAGPSAEIISSIQAHESCSIIFVNNASRAVPENSLDDPASRQKLQTFLVSTSTVTKLERILQNLKTSQWWNHMASFLIIDRPKFFEQGCSKAFRILSTAWKMTLLNAKFICHHESKGPLIYSYNPYTNQAPIPWQVEKTYRIKNEHPWTLLVRSYQDGQEICKDLDFDQTKDLGGYQIRAGIYSWDINKNLSSSDFESVTGINGILLRYMFGALNSTIKIFTTEQSAELHNMTISGFADICLEPLYQQNDLNISMTNPYLLSGLAAITKHRGQLSQIEKLIRVIDYPSRFGAVIVLFVTFVFFKFFLRQSVSSAILTIVRLVCNAPVPNVPNSVAPRIYLTGLFLFFVTMQAIYQGQLAALLTKSVALPDVETFEDLENYGHTIYGHRGFISYFKKLNFSGPLVPLQKFACSKYVLRDDAAACIHDKLSLVSEANRYKLHLSNEIINMFIVFPIREDWPVEKRLNMILSRHVEGNIIDRVIKRAPDEILRRWKHYEKKKNEDGFTVMTLKDLAFAFPILGIGLAGATVVFFVEIWIGRRRCLNIKLNRVWAMVRKVE